ncbi:MAG: deoxyribodipyrimidine photo-lyase [Verrucomicrobia bacterium]|nr:deoxyribodipyrimidine photo-lyase [Verrucomicrobiota bacterium]
MAGPGQLEVVWFKRDLRVADHAPLAEACARAKATGGRVLGFYAVEPSVIQAPDYSGRHWAATREALAELRENLLGSGIPLAVRTGEVVELLERLRAHAIGRGARLSLWSHEETGNAVTYARDRAVRRWARSQGVEWHERLQTGVVRRLPSRDGWAAAWEKRMRAPLIAAPDRVRGWTHVEPGELPSADELGLAPDVCPERQPTGEASAREELRSFLARRGKNYSREMSSPRTAAQACSRLSVPLALGTISMRTVVQAAHARMEELQAAKEAGLPGDGYRVGSVRSFIARLHWHCHFMQKLEDEPRIETQSFVRAFDALRATDPVGDRAERLAAWSEGRTGYPLIDACMRSLRATGWINFRMRAMLMSFASYDLWLPWRESGLVLARLFTDYEPGIHWSQVQMQSGTTGINALRMYSPLKQSLDQDPKGEFIRRWVPELAAVPEVYVHEPWRMTPATQAAAACVLGRDYPLPIVDHKEAVRQARAKFGEIVRRPEHRAETQSVLKTHGSRKRSAEKSSGIRRTRRAKGVAPESGGDQLELGV